MSPTLYQTDLRINNQSNQPNSSFYVRVVQISTRRAQKESTDSSTAWFSDLAAILGDMAEQYEKKFKKKMGDIIVTVQS